MVDLADLVDRTVDAYAKAAADLGPDLSGYSLVDLVLDQSPPHVQSVDVKRAIIIARRAQRLPAHITVTSD